MQWLLGSNNPIGSPTARRSAAPGLIGMKGLRGREVAGVDDRHDPAQVEHASIAAHTRTLDRRRNKTTNRYVPAGLQRLHEDIAFRVLTANNTPDFRTISDFRKDHLEALTGLFLQVLALYQRAGLVKLGHVALDRTKVRANASKHKAMSYRRMKEKEVSADAGCYSARAVDGLQELGVDPYVAPEQTRHGRVPPPAPRGRIPRDLSPRDRMRRKLQTKRGRQRYVLRMATVEPVFGQIG